MITPSNHTMHQFDITSLKDARLFLSEALQCIKQNADTAALVFIQDAANRLNSILSRNPLP